VIIWGVFESAWNYWLKGALSWFQIGGGDFQLISSLLFLLFFLYFPQLVSIINYPKPYKTSSPLSPSILVWI